jgi:hypothetical protein
MFTDWKRATNMESENKVLRQQAVAISPAAKSLATYPKSLFMVRHAPEAYVPYIYFLFYNSDRISLTKSIYLAENSGEW